MIIIRVELHSAITHKITELARMCIANDGTGNHSLRNYNGFVYRGRDKKALDKVTIQRTARVENHPSERMHIWHLVAKMLKNLGYMDG